MSNTVSLEVQKYLQLCGISAKEISLCTKDTRLYHDLNVYGDIAETCIEVLESEYSVDLTNFVFDRYFPTEYVGDSGLQTFVYWVVPFLGKMKRNAPFFEPIKLSDVDGIIKSKSWSLT